MTKLKEGDSPLAACSSGQVLVHLSGGDITAIKQGTGVVVTNGTNGEATVSVDPGYALRQDCANDKILKWDGDSWECADDKDTTYSEGTGLDLNPTTNAFSIEPAYRVKNTPDCSSGQFATGFDDDGEITCAAPSNPGSQVWIARSSFQNAPSPNPPGALAAQLSLPAGLFLASASLVATSDSGSEDLSVECNLRYTQSDASPIVVGRAWGDIREQSIAMSDVVTLAQPGTLQLRCWSHDGGNHVESVRLIATKIGSATTQ